MNDWCKSSQPPKFSNVLAACAMLALVACAEEDPQKYVQEGRGLFEKGDMESARVQFKNALQAQPKLTEAYYGLALIDERSQDWKTMFANLQEAVTINPNYVEAQIKLGQIFMLSGELDKAREKANLVNRLAPDDLAVWVFEGALLLREGKKADALVMADRVLAKEPAHVDASGLKASILATEKNFSEALAVLSRSIEAHPDDVGMRLLKIRLLGEQQQYPAVTQEFEALLAKFPTNRDYRFAFVDFLKNTNQMEAAEKVLRGVIAQSPDDVEVKLRLVTLLEQRDPVVAETTLKDFIEKSPKEARFKLALAQIFKVKNKLDEEKTVLHQVIDLDAAGKEGMAAKVRLAEIALYQNDKEAATQLIEQVLGLDAGNYDALLLRAGMSLNAAKADAAISDLRIVLKNQPNSDRAMIMMAQAYSQKGEVEVAESHWRKALEISPANLAALVPVTQQYLKRNDSLRAQDMLDRALKVSPNNPAIIELMLQVKMARKDWSGAEAIIASLPKTPESEFAEKMAKGLLASQRGQYDAAIGFYKDVLAKQPSLLKAWSELANAYRALGRTKELPAYLKGFLADHSDSLPAYSLLAITSVELQQWDEAEKALRGALQKVPDDIDFKVRLANLVERRNPAEAEALLKHYVQEKPQDLKLKLRLAAYYKNHGRFEDTETVMKEIAQADTSGAEGQAARIELAQLAVRRQDAAAANAVIDDVLKTNPDNLEALLIRASLRIDVKSYDAAETDLQHILDKRPDADRARLMLAEIYLLKNDTNAAEAQWQKILARNPAAIEALTPWVARLRQRGEDGLAETALEKALQANPADPRLTELMVQLKIAHKDWLAAQSAIDALSKSLKGAPAVDMLQGVLSTAQGKYPEAIKAFKDVLAKEPKADMALTGWLQAALASKTQGDLITYLKGYLQKQPDNLAGYHTLGAAYAAEGKWAEAEQVLRQALAHQPKSASTLKLLADAVNRQGKQAEALEIFQQAAALQPEDLATQMRLAAFLTMNQKIAEAKALYQRLMEKYPDSKEVINNLADLLVNQEDSPDSTQQAVKLVELIKDSNNPYYLDTYGWVMLKAGQSAVALDALKKAVAAVPELAPLRYHLGEAFDKTGDTAAALVQLNKALELAPKQPDFKDVDKVRDLQQRLGGKS